MRRIYSLLLLIISFSCFSQEDLQKLSKPIIEEGKRLYKSEMASWYGTDIFFEKYKNKENIGGYLSYSEKESATCIFFEKGDNPKVIGTITFDSTYNTNTAKTDLSERKFTKNESDLFAIRAIALKAVNSDTIFKMYSNTSLNLIPIIHNGEKKVYILTGPQNSGVVIFGNDYLLTFNKQNKLISKRQLHKNIIPIEYASKDGTIGIEGIHSHLPETGDLITATDICTLMLYEKFAKWERHTVVSKKYISIWDCKTDELAIITTEAFEAISDDRKSKN